MSAPDFEKQGWALLDEYATRYSSGDHDDANYLASKLRAAYEAGARDEREAIRNATWNESDAFDMVRARVIQNVFDNACDEVDRARGGGNG